MHDENCTNEDTFTTLYHQFKNMVYNVALSYLHVVEDAEEVTQDVFLEVHRSMQSFRAESAIKTWIYRITINKSLDFLRYKNRKKRFAFVIYETDNLSIPISDFVHPGITLENKERSALLFKAISLLPENQKTAFILSKIEGLSNIEISSIMQNSVGAVESLLSRAKENLRKQLEIYYNS